MAPRQSLLDILQSQKRSDMLSVCSAQSESSIARGWELLGCFKTAKHCWQPNQLSQFLPCCCTATAPTQRLLQTQYPKFGPRSLIPNPGMPHVCWSASGSPHSDGPYTPTVLLGAYTCMQAFTLELQSCVEHDINMMHHQENQGKTSKQVNEPSPGLSSSHKKPAQTNVLALFDAKTDQSNGWDKG